MRIVCRLISFLPLLCIMTTVACCDEETSKQERSVSIDDLPEPATLEFFRDVYPAIFERLIAPTRNFIATADRSRNDYFGKVHFYGRNDSLQEVFLVNEVLHPDWIPCARVETFTPAIAFQLDMPWDNVKYHLADVVTDGPLEKRIVKVRAFFRVRRFVDANVMVWNRNWLNIIRDPSFELLSVTTNKTVPETITVNFRLKEWDWKEFATPMAPPEIVEFASVTFDPSLDWAITDYSLETTTKISSGEYRLSYVGHVSSCRWGENQTVFPKDVRLILSTYDSEGTEISSIVDECHFESVQFHAPCREQFTLSAFAVPESQLHLRTILQYRAPCPVGPQSAK